MWSLCAEQHTRIAAVVSWWMQGWGFLLTTQSSLVIGEVRRWCCCHCTQPPTVRPANVDATHYTHTPLYITQTSLTHIHTPIFSLAHTQCHTQCGRKRGFWHFSRLYWGRRQWAAAQRPPAALDRGFLATLLFTFWFAKFTRYPRYPFWLVYDFSLLLNKKK